ncbi:MAG: hypothetical protein LBT09_07570 [Planctomycetaceae bacterium]|jgi:hypothetical protein|nr:hypothetical protein [Planctomycetaceae bacterium]
MTSQNLNEYLDKTIDSRIDAACKLLFKTEFWTSVLFLTVFLIGGIFIAVIADHWLFSDGLSVMLRLLIIVTMLTLSVFFVYRRIVPLFLYPINPVYAAQILESNSASTKNAIINWITLKRERLERGRVVADKLGEKMLEGLTRTAAENINAVSPDRIVNKTGINIYIAVLVIIVTILFLYSWFSPKNSAQSFARIILPFVSIAPPQAVQFLNIEPQNTTALQGEHLTVSAKVIGKSKSPVYVFFSTDDGRAVKQAMPMTKLTNSNSGGGGGFWGRRAETLFEAKLPPMKQGFICGTEYWIQQDNSKSNTYRIEVRPVATVEIESLAYRYPDYTGLADAVVTGSGDIRAVSGTDVTVRAKSTVPLMQADIVYEKNISANNNENNPPQIKMQIDQNNPTKAAANIALKNNTPQNQNTNNTTELIKQFTINATDKDGFKSRRSGTFRQEIIQDKTPIVQWNETAANLKEVAQIELPVNAEIELPLQAEDPDFAIRYLRIKYKITSENNANKQIRPSELLQSPITGATEHKGQIKKSIIFKPSQHQLNIGDSVDVWGEAVDTKLPKPNTAETRHITIKITKQKEKENKNETEKDKNKEEQQQQQSKTNNDNPKNNNTAENKTESNGENEKSESESGSESGNKSESENRTENDNKNENENENDKSNKPIDPETQSGDAMQKIVDRMKKENWQPKSDSDNSNLEKQNQTNNPEKNNNDNNTDSNNTDNNTDKNNNSDNNNTLGKNNKTEKSNNDNNDNGNKKETGGKKENITNDSKQNQPDQKNSDSEKNGNENQPSKEKLTNEKNSSNDPNSTADQQNSSNEKNQNGKNQNGKNQNGQNDKSNNDDNASDSGETVKNDGKNQNGNSNNANNKTTDPSNNNAKKENPNGNNSLPSNKTDKTDNLKNNNSDGKSDGNSDGGKSVDKKNVDRDKVDPNKGGKVSQDDSKGNNVTKTKDQPVDDSDDEKRSRGDVDPDTGKIKNKGSDSSNPKKSELKRNEKNLPNENKNNADKNNADKNNVEAKNQNESGNNQSQSDTTSTQKNTDKEKIADNHKESANEENKKVEKGERSEKNSNKSNTTSNAAAGEKSVAQSGGEPDADENLTGNDAGKSIADNSKSGKKNNGSASGKTGDGGIVGSDDLSESEAARREFTERNVNLALDYLRDQLEGGQPNEGLLNDLGWTEEQLREFHKKWRAMSENAKRNNTTTKSNETWENALKSFNIRPTGNNAKLQKNNTTTKDKIKKSQSTNLAPPKGLKQKFEQYTGGIGK